MAIIIIKLLRSYLSEALKQILKNMCIKGGVPSIMYWNINVFKYIILEYFHLFLLYTSSPLQREILCFFFYCTKSIFQLHLRYFSNKDLYIKHLINCYK